MKKTMPFIVTGISPEKSKKIEDFCNHLGPMMAILANIDDLDPTIVANGLVVYLAGLLCGNITDDDRLKTAAEGAASNIKTIVAQEIKARRKKKNKDEV